MNILVLPSWYPTKDNPVGGSFFREQAAALARCGHRVSVAALFSDAPRGVTVEKTVTGELTEYAVHYKPLPFHLTFFRVLFTLLGLKKQLGKVDVLHAHSFQVLKYARVLKRLWKCPLAVTEHVTWFERGLLNEKQLAAIRRDYAACDAVFAVSTGLRETIRPLCGEREVRVVPNMVSERFFTGGLHAAAGDTLGLISVGSLEHKKGMDTLLASFAAAAAEAKELRLTLCGDGPDREKLEELARTLGIGDKVTFTGRQPREEVARLLRENQIFVLPSRTETFGIVFVEAMACGLPIVMTKTNAWELLVREETGLAVEIDDTAGLTDAILYMREHLSEYESERIRRLCAEQFSEEAVCRRLTEEYRRLGK